MKRNLLKEVISDAKMVKDVAIANAKKALEESINPTLKSMLVAKLEEMENRDEISEIEDEEIDLDVALSELTEEEEDEVENNEIEIEDEEEEIEDEIEDDVLDIENMTDEELSEFIQKEIEDMIEAGELEPGTNFGGDEEDDFEIELELDDEDDLEDDLESELDEILKEIESEEEIVEVEDEIDKVVEEIYKQVSRKSKIEENRKVRKYRRELNEAYKAVNILKKELNEINLLNSKLLYTNKIFKSNRNLKESQMIRILEAFDKAKSTNEAKLVYETLNENLKSQTPKYRSRKLQEGLKSQASRTLSGVKGNNQSNEMASELVARFQHLAGIK